MRPRLAAVLHELGIDLGGQTINDALTAESRHMGAASLVRCGLSVMDNGKLVSSGTIMPKAIRASLPLEAMKTCVARHLDPLPDSVDLVPSAPNAGHGCLRRTPARPTGPFKPGSTVTPPPNRAARSSWRAKRWVTRPQRSPSQLRLARHRHRHRHRHRSSVPRRLTRFHQLGRPTATVLPEPSTWFATMEG
ncbi:hypothetical protein G6F31_017312 [Rhizopus arrhizus]|nr:hypothetical protein G6F31_017312 [Rhizopus arrhizus]